MTQDLPKSIIDLSEKYKSLETITSPLDPALFFTKVPKNGVLFSETFNRSIYDLIERIFDLLPPSPKSIHDFVIGREGYEKTAKLNSLLSEYKDKHAYEGTLIISLIFAYFSATTNAAFLHYRDQIRMDKKQNPYLWELLRNFGRPTVPRDVLAIFAVYEAEKKLGKPMDVLTQQQAQVLGL